MLQVLRYTLRQGLHMKTVSELLNDAIPTTWSKAIAAMTLLAIPAAYNFPSILPPTYLPTSQEQVFLIRLLLSALLAFLGTFVTLFLVVRAYNELIKKHEKEIAKITTSPPPPPPPIEYKRKHLA